MARRIKLTDARIGKLRAGDVEYTVWDTRILGFGVRIRPTGHKSYVYHRHAEGQSRKFTFGPVALENVDEARHECMEGWGRMQSGERAEGVNGVQAPMFRDFVKGSWRKACYEPCKPSTRTSKDWALNTISCCPFLAPCRSTGSTGPVLSDGSGVTARRHPAAPTRRCSCSGRS